MKQKILVVVKFNQGECYVLKYKPKIIYKRYGDLLIGNDRDRIFYIIFENNGYKYGFKAFGGREFDIPLLNGEIIHANGQWWCQGHDKAEKILGIELIHTTYSTNTELCNCYVYQGFVADKIKLEKLRKKYKGKIWGYWEYEEEIKKLNLSLKQFLRRKNKDKNKNE